MKLFCQPPVTVTLITALAISMSWGADRRYGVVRRDSTESESGEFVNAKSGQNPEHDQLAQSSPKRKTARAQSQKAKKANTPRSGTPRKQSSHPDHLRETWSMQIPNWAEHYEQRLSISNDGRYVVVFSRHAKVIDTSSSRVIWDWPAAATARETKTLERIHRTQFSRSQRHLALIQDHAKLSVETDVELLYKRGSAVVLNLSQQPVARLDHDANCISFAPHQDILAVGSVGSEPKLRDAIKLIDLTNNKQIDTYSGFALDCHVIAYSSDGQRLYAYLNDATGSRIVQVNMATHTEVSPSAWTRLSEKRSRTMFIEKVSLGVWSQFGIRLSHPSMQGLSNQGDLKDRIIGDILTGDLSATVWSFSGSINSARPVISARQLSVDRDRIPAKEVKNPTIQEIHNTLATCVAAATDGSFVVSGGRDGVVALWDPKTGKVWHKEKLHDGPVVAIAISDDASHVITLGQEMKLKVWKPEPNRTHATAS